MDVNDQLKVSAAFLLGKKLWPPSHRRLGETVAGLDVATKRKIPLAAENQIPAFQNTYS
jgi:hypothetical protein